MGPSEHRTESSKNQERFHRPRRRPRQRRCLLKGCCRIFHPTHPLQRYCSEACRRKAKKWRRWKDQQKYRATELGKKKRKEQGDRRRERLKKAASDAASSGARVSPIDFFSALVATGLDATKDSIKHGALPCSVFVRTNAGVHWSGFWKENAVGINEAQNRIILSGLANGV
jgi:hypothetical protein